MFSTNTLQSGGLAPQDRVGTAIARASARAGVDFSYMMNQAKIESSLNPNARASTSSATGLYQFLDQTWLGTVKKHGAENGLGWAADAVQQGRDGRYRIADPEMRKAVLDLRKNPEAAASMAAEFAADNRDYLESKLGRAAEPVDLYLAHFLGAAGASKFLSAHDANPDASAASVAPAAARSNRWVFYNRDGSPRSLAEVRERFAAKIGGDSVSTTPSQPASSEEFARVRMASMDTNNKANTTQPIAGPSPRYAKLAYMMLAELGA
jgi:hypothetical protein